MAEINLGRVRGSDANVTKTNITEALGYTPADADLIGLLASLTTEQKTNLVAAINEVNNDLSSHEADMVQELNQRIKNTGGYISGKLGIGMKYDNVVSKYIMENPNLNGIKIKTNISSTKEYRPMITIVIEGYNYAIQAPMLLYISFYYYGSTNIYQVISQGASSINSYQPEIKVGFEDGKLVIWLSDNGLFNTYSIGVIMSPFLFIGVADDWELVEEGLSPTAEGVIIVPYKQ